MHRISLILICLTVLTLSVQAEKKRTVGIIFQPSLHEPDAQMSPLPSAPPLVRQHEVTIRRRHTTGKRGIDVSHYQDHINWDAVAEDHDVSYVYIKATEHAGLVDSKFQVNLREAHRVGIPVGCYHFFSPTAAPLAQLQNMTSAVPDLKKHDLVPMIDVEVKGRRTSAAELRSRLKQFLKGVENYYGIRPIIYTGQNFYNDYLAGYFEDYLFMIAKYSEEMPELNGTPRFAMWQYSASGRVKGIKGAVDRSCFVDNYSLRDILIKKK